MDIDYNANFGIGYKVSASEDIAESEELEDGLRDYLDCECGEEFDSFEVGNAWSGDIDFTCLIILTQNIEGLDLSEAKAKLDEEVERLGLDVESEFGLFGGVYCY
mgnify:CR=1 FL=1